MFLKIMPVILKSQIIVSLLFFLDYTRKNQKIDTILDSISD